MDYQLKNYSIAKYVGDQLVTRKGDYNYPTVAASWFKRPNTFTVKDGYSHYIYQEQPGRYTLVSKEISDGLALFTSFSYLLIIYGLLLLVPLGYNQLQRNISFNNIKLLASILIDEAIPAL